MSQNPSIDQYLLSTCLFIIDEFNEQFKNTVKSELKTIACEKFNEMDICVRIGYPFKQMAHYTKGDANSKKSETKINHDIYVENKDFKIEVKYLRNWGKTYSNSANWEPFEQDFNWLINEIKCDNKGKRAFIIGWFNWDSHFSKQIQLGEESITKSGTRKRTGSKPLVSEKKVCFFPFLSKTKIPTLTTDLIYEYKNAYNPVPVNYVGENKVNLACLFLGNKNDLFHFAIYY